MINEHNWDNKTTGRVCKRTTEKRQTTSLSKTFAFKIDKFANLQFFFFKHAKNISPSSIYLENSRGRLYMTSAGGVSGGAREKKSSSIRLMDNSAVGNRVSFRFMWQKKKTGCFFLLLIKSRISEIRFKAGCREATTFKGWSFVWNPRFKNTNLHFC